MRQFCRSIENEPWACVTPASTGRICFNPLAHISGVMFTFSTNGPAGSVNSTGSAVNRTCGARRTRPPLTVASSGSASFRTPLESTGFSSAAPTLKP